MDLTAVMAHRFDRKILVQIVDYVIDNEARFKQLINILLTGVPEISARSAWPLSYCVEQRPNWIRPQIGKLLRFMEGGDATVGAKRNILRALQFTAIPRCYHARMVEACFRVLADKRETVAVKVFAMTIASGIAMDNPDLAGELKIVIEDRLPYESAGYRSRAARVLRDIAGKGNKRG